MKLIFLLIIGLLQLTEERNCSLLGKLTKKNSLTTRINNYCVYIDTYDFEKETEFEIKATVYKGYFVEEKMCYVGNNSIPSVLNTESCTRYCGMNYPGFDEDIDDSYYQHNYNSRFSYYFKIPKPRERYLFVSIPNYAIEYDSKVKIEFGSLSEVWVITIIVIVSIFSSIIISVIIYAICTSKRKRKDPPSGPLYYPSNNSNINNPPAYTPPPELIPPSDQP